SEGRFGSRRRRQRRLRYGGQEQPEKEETAVALTGNGEESVAAEVEAEEEPSSRRRRRPRRRRGGDTDESETAVEATTDDTVAQPLEEYSPYVIVHHEPLERITDDDMAITEGDLLKDAIVQEIIAGHWHAEERRTELLEVEPTPEIEVGSLRHSLAHASDF